MGRILSLLPLHNSSFASLPPHFKVEVSPEDKEQIRIINQKNDAVIESLDSVMKEQQELTNLIPLSAASSGMVVGQKQLENLRQDIRSIIRECFTEQTVQEDLNPSVTNSSRQLLAEGYTLYTWGGKHRHCPEDMVLNFKDSNLSFIWALWWAGIIFSDGNQSRPFRSLLTGSHHCDLIDAYKHRREPHNQAQKLISQTKKVMMWFESLMNEATKARLEDLHPINQKHELELTTSSALTELWPTAKELLNKVVRKRKKPGSVPTRNWDLSRCTLGTVYERLCILLS